MAVSGKINYSGYRAPYGAPCLITLNAIPLVRYSFRAVGQKENLFEERKLEGNQEKGNFFVSRIRVYRRLNS